MGRVVTADAGPLIPLAASTSVSTWKPQSIMCETLESHVDGGMAGCVALHHPGEKRSHFVEAGLPAMRRFLSRASPLLWNLPLRFIGRFAPSPATVVSHCLLASLTTKIASPTITHGYKYRLVYLEGGRRVVGFDNERGKGDHKHVGENETPYFFIDVDRLIDDFIAEVEKWKNAP